MKCDPETEWVTQAIPISPFASGPIRSQTLVHPCSSTFSNSQPIKLPKKLHVFVPFRKFTSFRKMFGTSLLSEKLLSHKIPYKILVHHYACFVGLYFFGPRNEDPGSLQTIKNYSPSKTLIPADRISLDNARHNVSKFDIFGKGRWKGFK